MQRKSILCILNLIQSLYFSGCTGPDAPAMSSELGPAGSDQSTGVAGGEDSKQGPPGWIRAGLVQPHGLIRNLPEASPGYVLFTQLTSDTAYLIDLEGRVVHTWATDLAADAGYLLDDGSLVRQARIAEPENFKAGGVSGYLQRVSWDGDVLWQPQDVRSRRPRGSAPVLPAPGPLDPGRLAERRQLDGLQQRG
jgi:hypothetical protein